MATSKSQNPFSSSSSSSKPELKGRYDIFLSFRGSDTRKKFTDHLNHALMCEGFQTFRDDDEIERGDVIESELLEAIRNSRMSVIVLSENYANSTACLFELQTILELCKKSDHFVLPVFYEVEPEVLKGQSENLVFENMEATVERYVDSTHPLTEALRKKPKLSAFSSMATSKSQNPFSSSSSSSKPELKGRYDIFLSFRGSDTRKKFTDHLNHALMCEGFQTFRDDDEIERGDVIESELLEAIRNSRMSVIVLSENYANSTACLFELQTILELCVKPNSLRKLLVNSKARSIRVDILLICGMGGIGKTTIAKVVFNSNHARYDAACFLPNIREVAKAPNGLIRLQRQLLSNILGKEEHKVNDVDDGCRRMKYVLANKRVLLVLDDVDQTDQLSALAGQQDWFMPGSKIIITTRLESLINAHENYKVYRPEKLSIDESLELFSWHAFGQKHPIQGHMDLSKRFVHHCDGLPLALQVLGSSIRRKNIDVWESELQKLEAYSDNTILEKLEISYDSLKHKHDKDLFLDIACFFVGKMKNKTIKMLEGCDCFPLAGIHNLVDRNLLTIENETLQMHQLLQDIGKQIVCRESKYPEKRSRIWRPRESFNILLEKSGTEKIEGLVLDMNMLGNSDMAAIEANTFEKMYNLRLLKLSGVQLSGTSKAFPKRLRWLYWRGFPLASFPNDFPLENLVSLDMRYSNLKQLWKGTKVLGSLKILNLSHSPKLVKTPDFSRIPNLEKLVLKACPSLFEVDESIVELRRIESLNLQDCKKLRKLPKNIGMLESLVEIDISGCSNLMGAIEELGKMKSLQLLNASGMEVVSQASIWPWVLKPSIQMSLALPSSLVRLDLSNCNLTDDAFPRDLKLSKLQHLFLGGNPVSSLPNFIKDLTGLQMLDLSWCPKLQHILFPPIGLKELVVTECRAMEKITYETSASIKSISHGACMSLDYVQGGFKILPVKRVDVELINKIGFFNLDSMANVEAFVVNLIILQEGSIFSTYFPGTGVPHWFSNRNCGFTVSLTMTSSSPHCSFPGLNLCLVYTVPGDLDWLPEPLEVEVSNQSRGMKRVYKPRCYGIPEAGGDMVWLSHWLPESKFFEDGDELQVLFNLKVDGQIKECGAHILYFREDEIGKYLSTILHSWDSNMFRIVALEALNQQKQKQKEEEEEEEEEQQ
ncbi:hypothetical protein RHGRI_032393 [Rhododendron griersonianum]|uniref:TIR domain-containing protein n=1 Tax=Rhododendron griersonianum TaxID=479676 RepID=A0AAV6IHE6_9ERIC|nr:hypothetical protein RHGRI_032393 [Rhododendron griersonianum]